MVGKEYMVSYYNNYYDGMIGECVYEFGQTITLDIKFTCGTERVTFYKDQVEEDFA